jgi:hypothetical protein
MSPTPPGQGAPYLLDARAVCLSPDDPKVQAALQDIQVALEDMLPAQAGYTRRPGDGKAIFASRLIAALQGKGRSRDAAILAINKAIELGTLRSQPQQTVAPITVGGMLPVVPLPEGQGANSMRERQLREAHPGSVVPPNKLMLISTPGTASPEPEGAGAAGAADIETAANIFVQEGEVWHVRFHGIDTRLPAEFIGLAYIPKILAARGHFLIAYDLDPTRQEVGGAPAPLADKQALAEYARSYQELQANLAKAERDGNHMWAKEIQEEMDAIFKQAQAVKAGAQLGRSPKQKAWKTIRQAIMRAVEYIREHLPALATHLDEALRLSGGTAIYAPSNSTGVPVEEWHT